MATKSRLNINIETELKEEVGALLDDIGLDYTTAITIYFKQIVNERKILLNCMRKNGTAWKKWQEQIGSLAWMKLRMTGNDF